MAGKKRIGGSPTATGLSYGVLALSLILVGDFQVGAQSQINSQGINLDTWEAPREMRKAFPYYISGLDNKGQPVFIMEYGKWNVRKYFDEGGDGKLLGTYRDQMMYRWSKAERNLQSTFYGYGYGISGTGKYVLIVDMEGYNIRQLAHKRSLFFTLSIARNFVAANGAGSKIDYGFGINMNGVAETLINGLFPPILGDLFKKFELSGMDKDKWIPLLLRKIPRESLATWYGGTSFFRPLAVYG